MDGTVIADAELDRQSTFHLVLYTAAKESRAAEHTWTANCVSVNVMQERNCRCDPTLLAAGKAVDMTAVFYITFGIPAERDRGDGADRDCHSGQRLDLQAFLRFFS